MLRPSSQTVREDIPVRPDKHPVAVQRQALPEAVDPRVFRLENGDPSSVGGVDFVQVHLLANSPEDKKVTMPGERYDPVLLDRGDDRVKLELPTAAIASKVQYFRRACIRNGPDQEAGPVICQAERRAEEFLPAFRAQQVGLNQSPRFA